MFEQEQFGFKRSIRRRCAVFTSFAVLETEEIIKRFGCLLQSAAVTVLRSGLALTFRVKQLKITQQQTAKTCPSSHGTQSKR